MEDIQRRFGGSGLFAVIAATDLNQFAVFEGQDLHEALRAEVVGPFIPFDLRPDSDVLPLRGVALALGRVLVPFATLRLACAIPAEAWSGAFCL